MINNRRFSNILIFVYGFLTLLFAFSTNNHNKEAISIVVSSKLFFTWIPFLLGILSMIFSLYLLIKKPINEKITKVKKIVTITLLVYIGIYFIEFILLALVNSFIKVGSLSEIPPRSDFLNSVSYIILDYYDDFLKGVFTTLELSILGTVLGLLLAFGLVILRTMKVETNDSEVTAFLKKVSVFISKLYVNIFRGTPMMVQAMIIYYLFPVLIAQYFNIPIEEVDKIFTISIAAVTIVTLNTTAYLVEVLRGGIDAVDSGQLEAARSLGLGYWQSMFHIILPQAIKNALPSIFNEFIINIKDTSVLNVIGVAELFFMANEAQFEYFRTYEPFIIVALIYFTLTSIASLILAKIEKRMHLEVCPLPSSN